MRSTALILGAGASQVFGFPLGWELREKIATDLNIKFDFSRKLASGSHEIVEAIKVMNRSDDGAHGDIRPHRAAAIEIADAMGLSSSIDEYIERHQGDQLKADCAKLAIAKAILEAERSSTIWIDPRKDTQRRLHKASHSWLAQFLRDLTRGKSAENVQAAFSDLLVINFNYDRCFEHFLHLWLQDVYRLNSEESGQIVDGLNICHPYGSLGTLPWQGGRAGVAFGSELETFRLINMSKKIRTYSEAVDTQNGIELIRERLSKVKAVVFLGFGFHQQNLDLITLKPSKDRGSLSCFATRHSISDPKWEVYQERIRRTFAIPAHRDLFSYDIGGTCEDFWREFSDVVLA